MSKFYFATLVNCLEAMLPQLPGKQFTVHSSQQIVTKSVNRQPSTVNQTLVLVPNLNRLPETLAKFPNAKNHLIYHNQLKMSERFGVWLKILQGSVDYIFGLRSAIFTPCPNLAKIIIFDEHDQVYKDVRSPYFDTLTIAEKLEDLTDAKIKIFDSSPKISTYFTCQTQLKFDATSKNQPKVKIVSMTNEREIGNKSPISQVLETYLKKIYKIKGRSLMFLNKKIESGQIYCHSCKYQTFTLKIPDICPNCQSADIYYYSLNIASLANIVRQIIPKITFRLIAEGIQTPAVTHQEPTIDIATSAIFYSQIYQKYDLVAHVSIDSLTNIADFATSEKAYTQITDLKKLVKENGTLILQTYNAQSELIEAASKGDFLNFYNKNLKERKILLYPPYAILVKLTIRGKNREKITQKTKGLLSILKQIKKELADENIFILGPYQTVFSTRIPSYNIILKHKINSYSLESRQAAILKLIAYIKNAKPDWQITVEPASLN